MKIPAYIDATNKEYNDKMNRELAKHQERALAGNLNKYNLFNNFDPRDRSVNNSGGYWSWEEIESALLDRSEIDEDKKVKILKLYRFILECIRFNKKNKMYEVIFNVNR